MTSAVYPRRTPTRLGRRLSLSGSAITLTVLALALARADRARWLSPGPLRSAHAAGDCARCHGPALSRPLAWLGRVEQSGHGLAMTRRCQACHATSARPHGLPDGALAALTSRIEDRGPRWRGARLATHDDRLACASCHPEHRGPDTQATVLPAGACQQCHARPFATFAAHPEFARYPAPRRASLRFDHARKEHTKKACDDCHAMRDTGRAMTLAPFESTCAECHDRDFARDRPATVLLAVPMLDLGTWADEELEGLTALRKAVGDWPVGLDAGRPGWSPLLVLLACGEPEHGPRVEAALRTLQAAGIEALDGDAIDGLDADGDPARLTAARTWLLAVKRTLAVLRSDAPRPALRDRLTRALGRLAPEARLDAHVERLVALLPTDRLRAAIDGWFPRLSATLARRAPGTPRYGPDLDGAPSDRLAGWSLERFDLAYRPAFDAALSGSRHADPVMRRWLEDWLAIDRQLPTAAGPVRRSVTRLLASLATHDRDKLAQGACGRCHLSAARQLRWQPALVQRRPLVTFDHRAHLGRGRMECTDCHALDASQAAAHSDFAPITKARCAECHGERKAASTCTTCHRYHGDR